jgi:hypothetical protein
LVNPSVSINAVWRRLANKIEDEVHYFPALEYCAPLFDTRVRQTVHGLS